MDLDGRTAIVTGSASGIGAAAAKMLAERGCNVVINFTRSEAEAKETAAACAALGAESLIQRADVARDEDCRRMAAAAMDRWGGIDVLVNSAGMTRRVDHADLEGLSAEDFQRVYAVNTIGPFQMIRAVAPPMQRAGAGAVVNVSAGAAFHGGAASIAYAASKGALNTMTKSLARALAPEIRVNAVCPGFVQSRWLRRLVGDDAYERRLAAAEASFPLRRANTPEDVAALVVWLIERGDTMTGELINIDAGEHLV